MRKSQTDKRNFTGTDDEGNRLSSTLMTSGKILLSVTPRGSGKAMYIGYIDTHKEILVLGRLKEHLHQNEYYGVPEYLLQHSIKFKLIQISDEDESFLVKKSVILGRGHTLSKKINYLTQRFISLTDLRRYNEYEKERSSFL